jgi:dephospho-CoA kinase
MSKTKNKIAITGNIGCGKSTFSEFAAQAGYPVIYADDISRKLLSQDEKVRGLIIKHFGNKSFINSEPDKNFLAKEVFSDPDKLLKLESILHPRVIQSIEKLSTELIKLNDIVIIEAALIYEADMEAMFDYVILITSKRDLRLKRKIATGMSEEDFSKRELNQLPEDEKKKRADFIFSNNGTVKDLNSKFKLLLITLGFKS